jgi:cytochrome c oxidase subunit 3
MASGKTIEGILMPMPVAFKHDGAVDHAATDAIIDFYLDTGVHGFFPLGTHGQGMTMEIDERKQMAEQIVNRVKGRVPVVMHIGTANTLVLITSSITTVMAWASCKMNQFERFKFYHACTLVFALTFVCIKSYEYHDKLTHYEITLADGKIADGHLVRNNPKEDNVVISGRYVEDRKELYDLHAQKAHHPHEELTIPRAQIKKMDTYGPWHNTYTAIYFTLTGLHALHVIGGALVIGFLWGPGSKMWRTDPERFTNRVEVSGLFWHFVDLVWIFLFPVLYLL